MDTQQAWPVVVGVDGSDSALDAVRWGADEATRRGLPLRLLAAVEHTTFASSGTSTPWQANLRDAVLQAAQGNLDAAADEILRTHPDLVVERDVRGGSAPAELAEASGRAQMLVLGTRGRGGFAGLLAGSVAVAMASRARCTVVVVRGVGPDSGPVVVGLDGSRESDAALAFAVEEAAARRVPLVALRAWRDDVVLDAYIVPALDRDAIDAAERGTLETALAGWSGKFPDVEMRPVISHEQPAPALIALSSDAQLVVVGSHGRGALSGLMLGSVSQALIQHAHCPVAVARLAPIGTE